MSPKGNRPGQGAAKFVGSSTTVADTSPTTTSTQAEPLLAAHAAEIRRLGKRVIADVVEIGGRLADCKRICGHGRWLPWLDREFGWTDDTALNFMRVHELAKSRNFRDLSLPVSSLYLLAAPSTPDDARNAVLELAANGEHLRHADVQAIIANYGEQAISAAHLQIRTQRLEKLREAAQAATAVAPSGPAGGTVEDLRRLAASGYRAGALLVDPPWQFVSWSHIGLAGDSTQENRAQRSRAEPYKTMSLENICRLPVEALAARDCVLFLWVIRSHLPDAEEVIKRWGFKFKSVAFVWMKGDEKEDFETVEVPIGTGLWTRSGSEQCWVATRGEPRRLYADVREAIIERRREHSRKPDCVHDRVQRLVAGPYLELFARRERAGWLTWGDEIPPPAPAEAAAAVPACASTSTSTTE